MSYDAARQLVVPLPPNLRYKNIQIILVFELTSNRNIWQRIGHYITMNAN